MTNELRRMHKISLQIDSVLDENSPRLNSIRRVGNVHMTRHKSTHDDGLSTRTFRKLLFSLLSPSSRERIFIFVKRSRADSRRTMKDMRSVTSSNLDHNSRRLLLFINTFSWSISSRHCSSALPSLATRSLKLFNLPVSLRHSECRLARLLARTSDVDLT